MQQSTLCDVTDYGRRLSKTRNNPHPLPCQVDVYDYSVLVACLEERSQAFVIKRVGWLAVWNACRPDGYIELAFDRREERQVAKVYKVA